MKSLHKILDTTICFLTGHQWIGHKQDFKLIQEILGMDLPMCGLSEDMIVHYKVRRCSRCWKKQRLDPMVSVWKECKLSLREEREKKLNEII